MADREDKTDLTAEEKIARALEEIGAMVDSQADRLAAKLEPVTRSVAEIEQQLEEMGYGPAVSRDTPAARDDTPSADGHADPRPSEPGPDDADDFADRVPDAASAPPASDPGRPTAPRDETDGPDRDSDPADEATRRDSVPNEAKEPAERTPVDNDVALEDGNFELLSFENARFGGGHDEGAAEDRDNGAPEAAEPDADGFADRDIAGTHAPEPEAADDQADGTPPGDDRAAGNEADPGANEHVTAGQSDSVFVEAPAADLPFDSEEYSEDDLSLADEALKSELEDLFDDGAHAARDEARLGAPGAPPTIPSSPKSSRPLFLLAFALIFLLASGGIGAFVWLELASPQAPRAIDERPTDAASTRAAEAASRPINPPGTTDRTSPPSVPAKPTGSTGAPPADSPASATASTRAPAAASVPETPATASTSTGAPTPPQASTPPPPPPPPAKPATPPGNTGKGIAQLPEPELTTDAGSKAPPDAAGADSPAASFNPEVEALRDAAAAGDSVAQNELAVRYLVGRGVDQNYDEAARWLKEAAAGGVVSAQYNLGVLYDSGRGVEADPVEALIWFHSAAEKGHGRAQYALAAAYAAGRGIARDSEMALKWLRRAAEKNVLEAQSSLANILATSPVSPDSLKDAYYWYRLADANGDRNAAARGDQVAERLTAEERAAVNRRVSAFIAANITGKRSRPKPPAATPTTGATGGGSAAAPASPEPAPVKTPPAQSAPASPTAASPTTSGSATTQSTQIRTIQTLLTTLGFEPGPANGTLTEETREAIRGYQRTLGLDIDGEPSEALLTHLRQITGNR